MKWTELLPGDFIMWDYSGHEESRKYFASSWDYGLIVSKAGQQLITINAHNEVTDALGSFSSEMSLSWIVFRDGVRIV